mgnify:CR=1 FL=1
MHQPERAYRMMNELVELLHIPATPEIQFVPLEEELHLMRSYMSIMNCRTEKDTVLTARCRRRCTAFMCRA